MSSAEIMTFAILSANLYGGDYRKTRLLAFAHNYFPKILSHSQLVRRIHKIPPHIWYMLFLALQVVLRNKDKQFFIVDRFPARIFSGKQFHGYTASKKTVFIWN